jgi:ABC-2 type transport system ATP-binding protein
MAAALGHPMDISESVATPNPEAQPTPGESNAIETFEITRRFGEMTAVDHINLRIRHGSIFGLLGPNGAGKSTTIKMLTTLLPPTSGTATVAGFDIVSAPREVRRRIGYVPQILSADGGLTGYENLKLSAQLYGIPGNIRKQRIEDALRFMGLLDAANKLVKQYSGGMIRRLEVAQAMLHRPAVLVLDEPTVGLDPIARQTVWERLLELRHDFEMTVLITTHAMEEADALCDTLAIMHLGKVAIVGKPDELKASVGEGATLNDVFSFYSGGVIHEQGDYRGVRQSRRTASRLG